MWKKQLVVDVEKVSVKVQNLFLKEDLNLSLKVWLRILELDHFQILFNENELKRDYVIWVKKIYD